jgi:hypothetical protein
MSWAHGYNEKPKCYLTDLTVNLDFWSHKTGFYDKICGNFHHQMNSLKQVNVLVDIHCKWYM